VRPAVIALRDSAFGEEITTERLLLRPPRRSDLAALDVAIAETLPDLVQWLPWAHAGHQRADTRRYLRSARLARSQGIALEYLCLARESTDVVGIASLHRLDPSRRSAGLGYWVRKSCQGRGFATEAAGALVQDGFRRLGLHRIEAHVATENLRSQRVPEKLGFTREGVARAIELVNGRWLDHVQYSLLARDALGPGPGRS
jgi:RimJ/RimL family protein N-acetyltransferase